MTRATVHPQRPSLPPSFGGGGSLTRRAFRFMDREHGAFGKQTPHALRRLLRCHTARLLVLAFLLPLPADAAEELRALWVDAFNPGLRNESETRQLVTDARRAGFNALFVQVRKRGDAYYSSSLEPRAVDVQPGFDPLRRLLALARDPAEGPRLEIHAWIVAFNIWNQKHAPPPQSDHPYRRHPDWLTQSHTGARWDGENYAFDPGHPEVHNHTFNVAMDLIANYDLDGLHWDYIRYAGRPWGYNEVAVQRFNTLHQRSGQPAPDDPAWLQFRRDQITDLLRRFYLTSYAVRPSLKISAATITWAPGITNATQWPQSAAFGHVLQDWRAWMEEGILDWNVPMTYFRQSEHAAAFDTWCRFIRDHQYRRRAALGLAFYLNSPEDNAAQMEAARQPNPAGLDAGGVAIFSYARPSARLTGVRTSYPRPALEPAVLPAPFREPASVPPVPWKTSSGLGHLRGSVTRAVGGTPIDGATVEIAGPLDLSRRTDAAGWFGAVDLAPGDFQVRVSAPGFETASADVTIRGATVASLEFALSELPSTAPSGMP